MNMKIWKIIQQPKQKRNFKKNCNCTYECALTYNILGNEISTKLI